ncbi:MAG: DNA polymerase III subunit beta [Deltaproteobacteria bacterium]|nr:DNA polymerase III subunit beta [Deltaproteobacteria bacterium]
MEFKIKKEPFLQALSWTQSIVERKTTMPILSNALFHITKNKLSILATDLEVAVHVTVNVETQEEGKICIQAKNLFDIVRELPDQEIIIQRKEQNRIQVIAGKSQFKIIGLSVEEFPQLPQFDENKSSLIEARGLREMIDKTFFSISSDESRYNLHGVFLEKAEANNIRLVATDGHRLSYVERELGQGFGIEKGVIIPKKAVSELRKLTLYGDVEEGVKISIDGRNLFAQKGAITLIARLIDGEFPEYQKVIPKRQDKHIILSRNEMIGALKRVSLLVGDRTRGVKFSFSSGSLELSSSNLDLGEAKEEISIGYKGENLQVGFNSRYFLDVLGVIEEENFILEINGHVGPCVIRSTKDPTFFSVIMPMRI